MEGPPESKALSSATSPTGPDVPPWERVRVQVGVRVSEAAVEVLDALVEATGASRNAVVDALLRATRTDGPRLVLEQLAHDRLARSAWTRR